MEEDRINFKIVVDKSGALSVDSREVRLGTPEIVVEITWQGNSWEKL